ncbi:MAG: septal ring lytic transglycosylase RlpA family protein [Longimicrobiales bacterium]
MRYAGRPGRCRRAAVAAVAVLAVTSGCGPFRSSAPAPAPYQEGIASWYGPGFEGRPTANGEIFDPGAFTAAHRSLPFGARIRVQNLANDRTVDVRINDRGPFTGDRIIDLSRAAAEVLDMIQTGVTRVRIFLLEA